MEEVDGMKNNLFYAWIRKISYFFPEKSYILSCYLKKKLV